MDTFIYILSQEAQMTVYLDCNATTPVEPSVIDTVKRFMEKDYGNAASPIHDYGTYARTVVDFARRQVASVVDAKPDEVIFTSGATESNNLALQGIAKFGLKSGKKHIITTAIEHKSILDTVNFLKDAGFKVDIIPSDKNGRFRPEYISKLLSKDTLMVSVMHVNNETGVLQPIDEIAEILKNNDTFLHVDAAQGFGKELKSLRNKRIDMISASGHKVYAPKGIGALIMRKKNGHFPPISPLLFGGGQEQGLRAGTLPVQLIAGFGEAAKIAVRDNESRKDKCLKFKAKLMDALKGTGAGINGEEIYTLPHTVNISVPNMKSDIAIDALKDVIAISSTSACTSHTKTPSHVLTAMGLPEERVETSLRFSWCHMTPEPDWEKINEILKKLRGRS
jgi:cysteine desulfurase